jgi:glycosyltransferase involved in cell wall biosynthesis
MRQQPNVSVIIATYNRAQYLAETIDSVLSQTFRSFELIVVDDGSTDTTRELLHSYGDRLRFYCQQNRGPSAARNLGVHHARGEWIAIQDSDDICAPNYLRLLYEAVQANPQLAMVFANGAYLDGAQRDRDCIIPRDKSRRLAAAGVTWADLFDRSIFRLQASLIRKDAYLALGGLDESLRICHDLDLAFKLFRNYQVTYIDEAVFLYRRHRGNISRDQELRLTENIRVIEKMRAEFPETEQSLGKRRVLRRLAYRYYRLAKARWRASNHDRADEALQKAVALRPCFLTYRLYQCRSWLSSRRMNLS